MGFGGFSGEMIFIFFLALILFGPKKMPEIGRQVARFLGEFRRASNEFRSQIESEINSLDRNDNNASGSPRQPPLQAPLGSLANRIFNPPSAKKLEASENVVAENAVTENPTAEHVTIENIAAEQAAAVETELAPSTAKAAPDA